METQSAETRKSIKIDNSVKYGLVAIVVLSVAYYLFINLPKQREIQTRQACSEESKTKAGDRLQAEIDSLQTEIDRIEKIPESHFKVINANPEIVEKREKETVKETVGYEEEVYMKLYEDCLSRNGLKR